ncbi:hypothetical protein BpHYR1_052864 [Brachionus plicatilis]|uniref:Uncharacterized protein n=1 Tax=Brachionus plicatilis TaxID=10195 RepID=A0A3M7RIP0_BRAPC|nr:hypothetical protein BpHYR1_052864 [Brachionus plicatilis]
MEYNLKQFEKNSFCQSKNIMKSPLIFSIALILIQMSRTSSYGTHNEPETVDIGSVEAGTKEARELTKENMDKLLSQLAILDQKLKHKEQMPEKLIEKPNLIKIRKSLSDGNDLFEMEFCSKCFLSQADTDECLYCHLKYLYKTSKRTKPSSKYWYTRAGK